MKSRLMSVLLGMAWFLAGATTVMLLNLEQHPPREGTVHAETQQGVQLDESLPLLPFQVVNAHEHLMSCAQLDKYFEASRNLGITRTIMLASSNNTLMGPNYGSADGLDENTQEILRAAQRYPDQIIPFCTIDPASPSALETLKAYVANGAKGLKLYTGHSNFYIKPLDTPDMMPIYAYCNTIRLPICWHINLTKYLPEFERVMQQYPDLIVIVPHFGVTFFHPQERPFQEFERLLDIYPNLYTDTSFGAREILVEGLEAVSRDPALFHAFFARHSDRILFGTDMVVTGNREKTTEWIESVIRACRDMLEKESFHCFLGAQGSPYASTTTSNPYGAYTGLALDHAILKKIYETNAGHLFPFSVPENRSL